MARRVNLDPLPIGIGVQKAVQYHTPGPSAILLGVVAATVGGATDDLLAGRRATITREGHWLLSVIVVGAVIFWLFTIYVAFCPAVVVTVIVVATLGVLSVGLGWTSPAFPGDDLHSEDP